MNPIFRSVNELTVNVHNRIERFKFFQENFYDNIYFIEEGTNRFLGFTNYNNELKKESEILNYNVDIKNSDSNTIKEWFNQHPSVFRLPVLNDKELIGEYFDADSFGMLLYKRIENNALSLMKVFQKQVEDFLANKKYTIDKIFPKQIREILSLNSKNVVSPSEIMTPILLKEISKYFKNRGIKFFVFDSIMHSELRQLPKYKNKENITLEEALSSDILLYDFSNNDNETFMFLKKHRYDLNRISKITFNGIYYGLIDYISEEFNIINGRRHTVGTPQASGQVIHLFGPCIIEGLCVPDDKTIASILQSMFSRKNMLNCEVRNHGTAYGKDLINDMMRMAATDFSDNDIVVWVSGFDDQEEYLLKKNCVEFVDCKFLAIGTEGTWFLDNPMHCNAKMNKNFAKLIFNHICKYINSQTERKVLSNYITDKQLDLHYDNDAIIHSEELKKYCDWISSQSFCNKKDKTGCVVINANPYTLGHRYLIKEALKKCDQLYIIIVEQNTGDFIFNERFQMVNSEWKNYPNIKILSGGNVLTSSLGFPEYFNRTHQLKDSNPLLNHKIFAEYVAPILGINIRFFGVETNDEVTALLNKTAISYLPSKGIEVIIIDRKRINSTPISAKTVRRLYAERNFEALIPLVPFSTYRSLINRITDLDNAEILIELYSDSRLKDISQKVKKNNLNYAGMFYKFGVDMDGESYMLKISQTENDRLNLFSESLGSELCKVMDVPCSSIQLVTYHSKLSLLSKNWDLKDAQFFPLSSYYEETIELQGQPVIFSYQTFTEIIRTKFPDDYDNVFLIFWKSFIIDYLLCNARGAGNIGFIHREKVEMAPIYDNSTFLSDTSDQRFKDLNFPECPMIFEGEVHSAFEIIQSFKDPYLKKALKVFASYFSPELLLKYIRSEEEEYLYEVIKYRYFKLFQ